MEKKRGKGTKKIFDFKFQYNMLYFIKRNFFLYQNTVKPQLLPLLTNKKIYVNINSKGLCLFS